MNPLALLLGLPSRVYWLAGLALAIGAAWVGHRIDVHVHEKRAFAAGQAATQLRWDAAEKIRADVAAKAEADARAEEQRRAAAAQEVIHAAEKRADLARADAVAAGNAAERLRQRVAALVASARSGQAASSPAAAASGPPATDTASMLADLLGRCVAGYRFMASVADAAETAGTACVRAYESLTP